jgi:hypothetical protein
MTLLLLLSDYGVYTPPTVEIANVVDEPRLVYDSVADINVPTLLDEPRIMYTGEAN